MYCTRCNGQIQAEDCNLSTLVARCRTCQHVFRFTDQLGAPPEAPSGRRRAERPRIFVVEDQASGYGRRIWWRWADVTDAKRRVFFAVAATFVFLVTCNLYGFRPSSSSLVWPDFVLLGFLLLAAVAVNYYLVVCILNRTTVELDGGQLAVRHGPLPWRGGRAFEMADVDEVVFDDVANWREGVHVHRFVVTVIDREGSRHPLLETPAPGEAQFIAEKLQQWLTARPLPPSAPKKSISPPSEAIHRQR
jgi:hypothetical protein